MLVVFVALIVGPVVAKRFISIPKGIPMDLLQPTGQNNNDTLGRTQTGSVLFGGGAAATGDGGSAATGGGAPAATTTSPFDRARLF
jgi:1,3-beta-glucan synthase